MLPLSNISPFLAWNTTQPLLIPFNSTLHRKTRHCHNAGKVINNFAEKYTSVVVENRKDVILCDNVSVSQCIDSGVVGYWLQSCSSIEEIKRIHAVIVKYNGEPVIYVGNNLISVYMKYGDLVAARGVFDKMTERNVVSWTAMLNGYEKHGKSNDALRLYKEFVDCGCDGNEQTYVCVFNLCSKAFDYELGRQLHASVIKRGMSNVILDCAVLNFYAHCSDLDAVFCVFDRLEKRDVVCWTTMITACSQRRRGQGAFALLGRMLSEGVDPNEFTISSLLNSCGEEKELKLGKQLHCAIVKKAYGADIYVGTSLVDMYAKCGKIPDARMVFDAMERRNGVAWTSIIAGYARNGLGEEAIKLFRVMKRLKVLPTSLTMVSVLRACGLLRSLSTGKELHAHIIRNFAPENIFIGTALVWLYCKCGEYTSATKILQDLPDKDVVSWTTMISTCARIGHEYESLEHLREMLWEGVEPNHFTYSSALKACAKLENIEQGRSIHSTINKTPALSNVFVGSALINMYAKCGHLSEALQVFDDMPERNVVSWKAMIIAYAKNGFCSEALTLVYRMQAEGIGVDEYTLSTVLTACADFKWDEESSSVQCLKELNSLKEAET